MCLKPKKYIELPFCLLKLILYKIAIVPILTILNTLILEQKHHYLNLHMCTELLLYLYRIIINALTDVELLSYTLTYTEVLFQTYIER